jgi:hypothetical protein
VKIESAHAEEVHFERNKEIENTQPVAPVGPVAPVVGFSSMV